MTKKLIIIGGVAAGTSAAAKARRIDPNLPITIYTDDRHISYAGCGLPYFIGGKVAAPQDLLARSIQDFTEQNITIHTLTRVESIDPRQKQITLHDLAKGTEYTDHYHRLIIATGARALVPPLTGIEQKGVFTLRTMQDSLNIVDFLQTQKPQRAAIIGGGYIGLEMVENLLQLGCQVTLIERAPHIIPNMDSDMADIVTKYLRHAGVEVRTGETVQGFNGNGFVKSVVTDQGEIPTDFVLLSIGVIPNSQLAQDCGLQLGPRKAILVDKSMHTSQRDILAAGDCATVHHLVTGEDAYIPLGTTANKQGRIAGTNAAGGDDLLPGVVGTGIARVLEIEMSRTGLSERECQGLDIDYVAKRIKSRTAAYYCPASKEIELKLIAQQDSGRLLGAQIVGYDGAAMRIDMLAAAITTGSTVEQLINMDLAYSPPFSPVWDPVLIALNQF